MRLVAAAVLSLALVAGVNGQTGEKTGEKTRATMRFGIELDAKKFPQNTPKDTLGSILKALGDKQVDYVLAHLTDPAFVDQRVAMYAAELGGNLTAGQKQSLAFGRLVETVTGHFLDDPDKLTELQQFLKNGEWSEQGTDAVANLTGLPRHVFMKQIAPEQWVLLNREK